MPINTVFQRVKRKKARPAMCFLRLSGSRERTKADRRLCSSADRDRSVHDPRQLQSRQKGSTDVSQHRLKGQGVKRDPAPRKECRREATLMHREWTVPLAHDSMRTEYRPSAIAHTYPRNTSPRTFAVRAATNRELDRAYREAQRLYLDSSAQAALGSHSSS